MGSKTSDVWTFFAQDAIGPFPYRWRTEVIFDHKPFDGHYVDLLGRSLPEKLNADPAEVLDRYLARPRTKSAQALSQKAVVFLDPEPLRGEIAWRPPSMQKRHS